MTPLEQLMQLKALTVRTGAVADAQVYQLKNYIFVLPDLKAAKFSLDQTHHIVSYDTKFTVPKGKNYKTLESEIQAIQSWIRQILWDDTILVIKKNGKEIYDSRN